MKKLISFFKEIANEEKIPQKDKTLLLVFLGLSILPPIFIFEWQSFYGFIISLFFFSFVPDYFFNIIDQNLLLSHYPFSMKSYSELKRIGQFIASITPQFISDFIWDYEKPVI